MEVANQIFSSSHTFPSTVTDIPQVCQGVQLLHPMAVLHYCILPVHYGSAASLHYCIIAPLHNEQERWIQSIALWSCGTV